ncbi:hypothetical protein K470DRAFT_221654 [Piedraia hortae CBS 480.64]|uniref:DNA helicase n=1 Tax=Piedraia hortae CBS 480.64 TaxID=1314780 RepID=A0A6A7BSQ8_9PEZI|nr:hypothetical protein K470DRAFT_221654 [Piedraia hortae CBS 480.64]
MGPPRKKRKKESPPWKFPVAAESLVQTKDGRRVSARVNGGASPSPQSAAKARAASPPWRSCEADVPSSFQHNGRRKSGRVNKDLMMSPGSANGVDAAKNKPAKKKDSGKPVKKEETVEKRRSSRVSAAKGQAVPVEEAAPTPTPKTRKSVRNSVASNSPEVTKPSPKRRKMEEQTVTLPSVSPIQPKPRIKLRTQVSKPIFPPPHPQARVPVPAHPPMLSIFQILDQYELKEAQQPYVDTLQGPPSESELKRRSDERALEEALIRMKLIEAGKPGGLLSREKCSIYDEEPQNEPPKQYGHPDHLASHALDFRLRLAREKANHKTLAKNVAHEAMEEWKRRHGPTEEDLMEEQDKIFKMIHKQCVADMRAKWEMVEKHVKERRRLRWEAAENYRRQERLQKQLEQAELMVAKQRGVDDEQMDDVDMDEDSVGDVAGGESSEEETGFREPKWANDGEEENMSESESESEDADGGEMGSEELAAYLAHRKSLDEGDQPPLAGVSPREDVVMEDRRSAGGDTTRPQSRQSRQSRQSPAFEPPADIEGNLSEDESVEMVDSDDNMSSSGSSGSSGSEGGSDDGDDVEDAAITTLGLLYSPKNLQKAVGLPTPGTSAEGDARDATTEPILEDNVDDQTSAGAAVKDEQATVEISTPVVETPSTPGPKNLVPVPSLLCGTLRSYQYAGLDWLASLYRNHTNGILADEMGLGKTIQTIALLAHLAEEKGVWDPHLVIVPTSVILNWVNEFRKFLPGFRVLAYYGSADERRLKRNHWVNDPHLDKKQRGYNVVITSYNVAMQDINAIRNVQWHYLVLDEAHNIRNFNSQRWQVLIRLKTHARLLLTGTPLQNSLTELWSLLTFLTAGDDDPAHGDLEEFLSHWKEPVKEIFERGVTELSKEAQKVIDQLHISLRPFLLRRLKTEVEKDLPKKTESVVVCKLSKRQRQLYQEYMGLASTRESLARGNAVSAGKVLLSLRRVCNHPDLFDPRPVQTSYAMETSIVEPFSIKEKLIRKLLGQQKEVPQSLVLLKLESRSVKAIARSRQLSAVHLLQREVDKIAQQSALQPGYGSLVGGRSGQRLRLRERKLQHLRDGIQMTRSALSEVPIYGSDLRELVTLRTGRIWHVVRQQRGQHPYKILRAWPALGKRPLQFIDKSDWLLSQTTALQSDVLTLDRMGERMQDTLVRFAFCPPIVKAPMLDFVIPPLMQSNIRSDPSYPRESDFAHEARSRTSIVFPDKRLLVYDSGKLQTLTKLLRELQAKNSRSLIFTQMTGTLNVLEQFLNLLNLPYLRLDGSTTVERRQYIASEFNRPDSKYQCMILSSRAGGVGLNLVGASSVIFFDLDWNPQMDRQCMDRAHRIGQVRDVQVFKMVSEKTVEENILRRAQQKSLLDQTVIQEGHFTTEYQQPSRSEANVESAIERFLGGDDKTTNKAIESIEEKEDIAAAKRAAEEERREEGGDDFGDRTRAGSVVDVVEEEIPEERKGHVDYWMVELVENMMEDVPFVPPPVRRLDKNGRDPSHRPKRKR